MTTFAGWQLLVYLGTGSGMNSITGSSGVLIDGIQRITYDYAQNIDAKEATGLRTAYALVEAVS